MSRIEFILDKAVKARHFPFTVLVDGQYFEINRNEIEFTVSYRQTDETFILQGWLDKEKLDE